MVNNEFPFSNRGEPMENKQFTFCSDPKYVKALNEMGVDIVSLANNHTLDYGRDALSDTFQTLDQADILYAGAGDTKERAYELQVIEKNGKKFGFLAASRVVPESNWKVEERTPGMLTAYDDTKLVQLIKEAQSECDFLSVYIHWGVEYDAYPQEYQTKIASDCFAAGADLVLGAHTHCLQGISYIEGKPVFYSLGNFVFGQSIDRTVAVKVQVEADDTVSYELLPVYAAGGTTKLMDTNSASALYQYMTQISDGITIGADGKIN
jgi:poly-gamma-glutamate capsule biosynthesis protein CapA/YwtB (metallophosphatase superfamily)